MVWLLGALVGKLKASLRLNAAAMTRPLAFAYIFDFVLRSTLRFTFCLQLNA